MPPTPPRQVTFCSRCSQQTPKTPDLDLRYYSDPGNKEPSTPQKEKLDLADSNLKQNQGYYSEPDAKYFEIDYEFLKELRKIARNNCPKCKRKKSKRTDQKQQQQERTKTKDRQKTKMRAARPKENYVYCNGRYHSDRQHCRVCCRVCNSRSSDTLDSNDDMYSSVSRSYSLPTSRVVTSRQKQARKKERVDSAQSFKIVSFQDSSNDELDKDETNYTGKSFTNDLKQFLLKPAAPRLSFRDKFITSFKQEFDSKRMSPKLKAIKGLWKSY